MFSDWPDRFVVGRSAAEQFFFSRGRVDVRSFAIYTVEFLTLGCAACWVL